MSHSAKLSGELIRNCLQELWVNEWRTLSLTARLETSSKILQEFCQFIFRLNEAENPGEMEIDSLNNAQELLVEIFLGDYGLVKLTRHFESSGYRNDVTLQRVLKFFTFLKPCKVVSNWLEDHDEACQALEGITSRFARGYEGESEQTTLDQIALDVENGEESSASTQDAPNYNVGIAFHNLMMNTYRLKVLVVRL